jgi:hypothetical protein
VAAHLERRSNQRDRGTTGVADALTRAIAEAHGSSGAQVELPSVEFRFDADELAPVVRARSAKFDSIFSACCDVAAEPLKAIDW